LYDYFVDSSTLPNQSALRLIWRIWHFLSRRQHIVLIIVTLVSVVQGFAITFPAIVVGSIVNSLLGHNVGHSLKFLVGELALLFITFAVMRVIAHVSLHSVLPQIEVTFRHQQVSHSLQTPLHEDDKRYSAELNSIISTGTKAVSDLIKISFGDLLPACVQAAWAVVLAFQQQWILGVLMVSSGGIGYLIITGQLKSQSGIRVKIQREKARMDGVLTELLQGKAIVRSLDAVDQESERIRGDAQALADAEKQHHTAMGLFDASKYLVESMFGIAVVLAGIWLVEHKTLQAGGVLTLYLLFVQFANPIREIHRMRDQASEAETQTALMFDLLDAPIDAYFDRARSALPMPKNPALAVASNSLCARYSDQTELALNQVTFQAPVSSFVGICGPTGSGKSTLIKCIAGITRPMSGTIEVFDQPLEAYSASDLSQIVAYASQRPYLVASSIRRNVTLGLRSEESRSDIEIIDSLRAACVWDEIAGMPGGLDLLLGEGGQGLSGGQGQRVVLARLLLRRPQLLLLDEATSALDNLREAAVMSSLEGLDMTVIAIAHRLSTLRNADSIYVMASGEVVQRGNHDELSSKPGMFRDLLEATDVPRAISPSAGDSGLKDGEAEVRGRTSFHD
jgi:ATP-binding cassette subfamily B protein